MIYHMFQTTRALCPVPYTQYETLPFQKNSFKQSKYNIHKKLIIFLITAHKLIDQVVV